MITRNDDPPDDGLPDPPECCGDFMEDTTVDDGPVGFRCPTCGRTWHPPVVDVPDPNPYSGPAGEWDKLPNPPNCRLARCPHGKEHSCAACDIIGDLGFDADRERRAR